MRIESQGKYLQTMLQKAQRNLSIDGQGNLEAPKAQLAGFNTHLPNFMEIMNKDSKENIVDMNEFDNNNHSSAFDYQ